MKKRRVNIILTIFVVLLVVATIAVCFYGEYSMRKNYKSNVTNAKEVLAPAFEKIAK